MLYTPWNIKPFSYCLKVLLLVDRLINSSSYLLNSIMQNTEVVSIYVLLYKILLFYVLLVAVLLTLPALCEKE